LALPFAAAIVCLITGLATRQPWFFVFTGWLCVPMMISAGLLYPRPTVNHQSRGLFTCPWPAVRSVRVVTDRDELRRMNASPRYYTLTNRWGNKGRMDRCNTGVLSSPFMRAALVIEVDLFKVTASRIRPARYYSNFKYGRFSYLVHPELSPTWVVPTRHPQALSAALQAAPVEQ
jgi:hypothetical protein